MSGLTIDKVKEVAAFLQVRNYEGYPHFFGTVICYSPTGNTRFDVQHTLSRPDAIRRNKGRRDGAPLWREGENTFEFDTKVDLYRAARLLFAQSCPSKSWLLEGSPDEYWPYHVVVFPKGRGTCATKLNTIDKIVETLAYPDNRGIETLHRAEWARIFLEAQ